MATQTLDRSITRNPLPPASQPQEVAEEIEKILSTPTGFKHPQAETERQSPLAEQKVWIGLRRVGQVLALIAKAILALDGWVSGRALSSRERSYAANVVDPYAHYIRLQRLS